MRCHGGRGFDWWAFWPSTTRYLQLRADAHCLYSLSITLEQKYNLGRLIESLFFKDNIRHRIIKNLPSRYTKVRIQRALLAYLPHACLVIPALLCLVTIRQRGSLVLIDVLSIKCAIKTRNITVLFFIVIRPCIRKCSSFNTRELLAIFFCIEMENKG